MGVSFRRMSVQAGVSWNISENSLTIWVTVKPTAVEEFSVELATPGRFGKSDSLY